MIRQLLSRIALSFVGTAALLFIAGGTAAWPAAWVFLVEMYGCSLAVGLWLARHDPPLLAERLSPPLQRGQERWDRALMATAALLVVGWVLVMGVDAARYHVSQVPLWVQGLGALGLPVSFYIVYRAFRENTYAAPVVRLQQERGQKVVTTGPYRYVRHPMYAGALLFFLCVPLLLGSWYGLVLAPLLMALVAVRALLEERLLAAKLNGYAAYTARVRYRLIPWVW